MLTWFLPAAPSRNFAQENIKRIRQVAAERKEKEDMLNKTTAFRALWGTSKQREDTAPVVKRGQGQVCSKLNHELIIGINFPRIRS